MTHKLLYDNCKALSPDGVHMFYCSRQRADSYIRRGLAKIVTEDPYVFQLNFEPEGEGVPDMQPKQNICQCCETTNELTRHHVIPYSFRRLMPPEWKESRSEDVVPLCRPCHSAYELESNIYREELYEEIQAELYEIEMQTKARKATRTLESQGFFLQPEKIEMLEALASLYKGDREYPSPEELFLDTVSDLESFCQNWKDHYAKWLKSERKIRKTGSKNT